MVHTKSCKVASDHQAINRTNVRNFIKCPADVKVEFNIQLTIYNPHIYYNTIINCVGFFLYP